MLLKLIARLVSVSLLALLIAVAVVGQEKKKSTNDLSEERMLELERKGHRPPSGPGFYIQPIQGTSDFSVLLTDANNTSLSNSLSMSQLEIFEGLLQAAKEFALTDEAVGGGTPITTRLMDKNEPSLIVDVSKTGNRSRVYVTLVGITGKLTADAGEIIRGSKKEPAALFLKMLSQMQEARASGKSQPQAPTMIPPLIIPPRV